MNNKKLKIFDIAKFSVVDGPNCRVTIFFQGCSFECEWCHSPHSKFETSPLLFDDKQCTLCKRCEESCPNSVHFFKDEKHFIRRESCISCKKCILACPKSSIDRKTSVLQLPTCELTPIELFEKVKPHVELCGKNGGVTLSGGEALLQVEGIEEFLSICKQNNIHTAVETSGLLDISYYSKVIDYVDYWLFGVRVVTKKNQNSKNNRIPIIKKNLDFILKHGTEVLPRIPMVPSVMDQPEILTIIRDILVEYNLKEIWLNNWNQYFDTYYNFSGIPLTFTPPNLTDIEKCHKTMTEFFIQNNFILLN